MKEKLKYLIAAGAISVALAGCGESNVTQKSQPLKEQIFSSLNCTGLNKESSEETFLTQNRIYLFNDTVLTASNEGITSYSGKNRQGTNYKFDSSILEDGFTFPPIIVEEFKSHKLEIKFKPEEQDGISGVLVNAQLDCLNPISFKW